MLRQRFMRVVGREFDGLIGNLLQAVTKTQNNSRVEVCHTADQDCLAAVTHG